MISSHNRKVMQQKLDLACMEAIKEAIESCKVEDVVWDPPADKSGIKMPDISLKLVFNTKYGDITADLSIKNK